MAQHLAPGEQLAEAAGDPVGGRDVVQQPVLEVEEAVAQRRPEGRADDRALDDAAGEGERVDDVDLPAVVVAQLGGEQLGGQVVA